MTFLRSARCYSLAGALATPLSLQAPNYNNQCTSVAIQHMYIKASKATKDLDPRPNYNIQTY
jgi:hypothetical protein